MRIIPIGIYGPYPPAGKATSCYLVDNGRARVVIDLGSGSLSRLRLYVRPQDVSAFIVTHLHYDHCADVLPLSYFPGKYVVYAPSEPTERLSLIKARQNFDTRIITSSLRFNIGGMIFEFAPTNHGIECYAVKVTEGNRFFVYTSDTAWSDNLVDFCMSADLVLADCLGTESSSHMTAKEGAELARLAGVRIIATHLHPETDAESACREAGIELIGDRAVDLW